MIANLLASLIPAASAAPAWVLPLPLGIPQFTQDQAARGAVYAGLQTIGIAASTYTSLQMWDAAEAGDVDRELPLRMISAGAVAATVAVWMASSIDGSRRYHMLKESSLAWNPQPLLPEQELALSPVWIAEAE